MNNISEKVQQFDVDSSQWLDQILKIEWLVANYQRAYADAKVYRTYDDCLDYIYFYMIDAMGHVFFYRLKNEIYNEWSQKERKIRNIEQLKALKVIEERHGVGTFSMCRCNRAGTRNKMCLQCINEELKRLER